MAEDTRNRPDYSSDHPEPAPASDPLAELARLIGQSDPFAELGKGSPAGGSHKPLVATKNDDRRAPEWLARPASAPEPDDGDYPPVVRAGPREDHAAPDDHPASYEPHAGYDRPAAEDRAHDDRYGRERYAPEAPAAAAQTFSADHTDTHYQGAGSYAADDRYRVTPPPAADYDNDTYYSDDGHMPPHGDAVAGGSRRRGGILTIAAVLGLAVIGTAGAFGYRAFTAGSGASDNPPVIKADPTPPKSVPPAAATAAADPQSKPFQERAPGASERVVSREEQPVAVPVAPARSTGLPQGAFGAPPALVAPPPSANEPKRVKTMTIRQDAGADTGTISAAPSAQAPGARAPAAKPSGAAPLVIAPQSEPSARNKVAVRTPPSVAAGGAYVVQVSAQKSEAEAQSSYQSLQAKYPSVLGSKQANIRRVDLGDKGGVFFRAQVGSFTTADQANAFCTSLKEAGGQCIVQKN